jgi:poly(A) polymerase
VQVKPSWLNTDPVQFLLMELSDGTNQAMAVGGCVRDALMGRPCSDVDIATPHTPDSVEEILSFWGHVKLIPTGVDHGTWTAVVDGFPFEITSFRKDVATDGRRATVAYSQDIRDDAQRRDFTMNALYMTWRGEIHDPTGTGIEDLTARRLRFVGDADERCREDYLRIMRLFRFQAQLGINRPDPEAFAAAMRNAEGLAQVSGERKWSELKKTLGAYNPCGALLEMVRADVLDQVLPDRGHIGRVFDVVEAELGAGVEPDWPRRYVALRNGDDIPFPASNDEKNYVRAIHQNKMFGLAAARTAFNTRKRAVARDSYVLACAAGHIPCTIPEEEIERGVDAECPVTGDDLKTYGIPEGKVLGDALKRANAIFVDGGFRWSHSEIMDRLVLTEFGKHLKQA